MGKNNRFHYKTKILILSIRETDCILHWCDNIVSLVLFYSHDDVFSYRFCLTITIYRCFIECGFVIFLHQYLNLFPPKPYYTYEKIFFVN